MFRSLDNKKITILKQGSAVKWPISCQITSKMAENSSFWPKNSYGRNFSYGRISAFIKVYLTVTEFRQKSSFGHTLWAPAPFVLCPHHKFRGPTPCHRTAESRQPEKLACVGVGTFSLNIRNFYVRLCLLNHFVPYLLQNNISASPEIGLQISISPWRCHVRIF